MERHIATSESILGIIQSQMTEKELEKSGRVGEEVYELMINKLLEEKCTNLEMANIIMSIDLEVLRSIEQKKQEYIEKERIGK